MKKLFLKINFLEKQWTGVSPKDNFVILKVIDLMGREVKTLVNSFQTKGNKSVVWNAINNQGLSVSAGVYFYSIESREFISTKKMILIK